LGIHRQKYPARPRKNRWSLFSGSKIICLQDCGMTAKCEVRVRPREVTCEADIWALERVTLHPLSGRRSSCGVFGGQV
jgi:hypothetical protein